MIINISKNVKTDITKLLHIIDEELKWHNGTGCDINKIFIINPLYDLPKHWNKHTMVLTYE